jgi:uncharacterized protein (TIGR04141 family)
MPSLTVYRLRDPLHGDVPDVFDQVIYPEALVDCAKYNYIDDQMTARLYLPAADPEQPRWAPFIRDGFGDIAIEPNAASQALLVVSVHRYKRNRLFAVAFGHARFLLRHELVEPAFGRRVALNLLYEDDHAGTGASRIRQVDARTIEANVRRARVQRSRDTTFETFGVDPQRDLMDRIVGAPRDVNQFGTRVSGGDSIRLELDMVFSGLGPLLRQLLTVWGRSTYRTHFAWIDKVRAVKDQAVLERLHQRTAELVATAVDDVDLAPPEIIDWDRAATFTYDFGDHSEYDDLSLDDYMKTVRRSRTRRFDYQRLVAHRVLAKDVDGGTIGRWSVARALVGEFDLDGIHYILDDGHFYAVAADYLAELDEFIKDLGQPEIPLPSTRAATLEDDYNKAVTDGAPDRLLLDKKTIQPGPRTTPIEICDVLTAAGELVHVKRKLGSSDLSHLFGQGYISAETIHAGPGLRSAVRERIVEQARAQKKDINLFSDLVGNPFSATRLTVVYAILANWKGKEPQQRLPFFSKVNLRHHTQQIRRMGFHVAFAAVDAL